MIDIDRKRRRIEFAVKPEGHWFGLSWSLK